MSSDYRVEVTRSAHKEILRLPGKVRRQVEGTIDRLLSTLNEGKRPQDVTPLKGEPYGYRIDSGEYRILFYLDDDARVVKVTRVRHRQHAYRKL